MCEEFCLIHGYEHMYRRDFRDPIRCCRMCEAEDANEKYHQDDLRDFEERTYPSPGDVQRREQ